MAQVHIWYCLYYAVLHYYLDAKYVSSSFYQLISKVHVILEIVFLLLRI